MQVANVGHFIFFTCGRFLEVGQGDQGLFGCFSVKINCFLHFKSI